jgi:paraquat-inducible protein B
LEEIGTRVSQLMAKFEKIPLDEIGQDLGAAVKGVRRVVASPELMETVKSLNAAVKELQLLTAELRTRTAPELTAAVEQARKSLAAAESTLGADAPLQNRLTTALEELAGAARALRVLADYLERHPESALFGKGNPE